MILTNFQCGFEDICILADIFDYLHVCRDHEYIIFKKKYLNIH